MKINIPVGIGGFDRVCGNCNSYNSDTLFCAKHPEWGELVEQDSCDDWSEDDSISE